MSLERKIAQERRGSPQTKPADTGRCGATVALSLLQNQLLQLQLGSFSFPSSAGFSGWLPLHLLPLPPNPSALILYTFISTCTPPNIQTHTHIPSPGELNWTEPPNTRVHTFYAFGLLEIVWVIRFRREAAATGCIVFFSNIVLTK